MNVADASVDFARTRSARRRVLMIAHEFYPCSAIGCHRTGKFSKYLPQFGWEPVVLTARRTDDVNRVDPSLLNQLPKDVRIIRTYFPDDVALKRTIRSMLKPLSPFHGGNGASPAAAHVRPAPSLGWTHWLAFPDWPVAWLPWAVASGLPVARTCDAIYATGPPHGALVIAAVLARLTGKRLVLDMRDPWTLDRTLVYPNDAYRRLNARLERWCFHTAAVVICNTPAATQAYRVRYPEWPDSKFVTLPNGFDAPDFDGADAARGPTLDPAQLHLAYVGNLHGGRDPRPLFRAIRRRLDEPGHPSERYRVHFWSATQDRVRAYVREADAAEFVEIHPPVPHRAAIAAMRGVDVLLVFGAADTDDLHVPGKLFEYVFCRKPTLALVEPGAISRLIDDYKLGLWCRPTDEVALAGHLRRLNEFRRKGGHWPIRPEAFVDFDRRTLAARLSAILGGD